MLALTVISILLLSDATQIVTGSLELSRWTNQKVSFLSALNMLIVWGFAYDGFEAIRRYVHHPLKKAGAYVSVVLLSVVIVNILGIVPPVIIIMVNSISS